ncbi:MAG: hypothetical protein ABSA54_03830 [Terriglobales bacterium]
MPTTKPSDRELFTRKLAAEFLCSSVQYVDKMRSLGLLPAYYVGPKAQSRDPRRVVQARRKVLFKRADLEALLEKAVL